MAHSHRPTLKQSNKGFKSKHATKGSRKAAAKGKIGSPASVSNSHKAVEAGSKSVRLNQQAQKRDAKQRSHREDAKFFSSTSGGGKAPRIISIVPLLPSLSPERFVRDLLPSLGLTEEETAGIQFDGYSSFVVPAPRFKTTLHLNLLPPLQLYPTLDAALVSDAVVVLLSSVDEVQLEGESILRCLQGQVGGVNIVPCVQAPEDAPINPANKSLIHKSLTSFMRYFFPAVEKIYSADAPNEALLAARHLCETTPATIRDPDGRSWLLAEGADNLAWEANSLDESTGTLRVVGTVRGGKMSANRLVHLPGHGDFQVAEIVAAPPLTFSQRGNTTFSPTPLSTVGEEADDLTANNVPDLLANEQTWPTEEEMMSAPGNNPEGSTEKRVKRVPKGTSAYQAAWIVDDDEESEDDEEISEDGDMESEPDLDGTSRPAADKEEEEMEEIELDERENAHEEMEPEEEEIQYEAYLKEREKAQQEDMYFPDEIDTPRHVPARTRFQRYRGLRSFRTSPWDPYENLPLEYGEIFQFENFAATQKRVEREAREEGVEIGTRVILVIRDVPRSVVESRHRSAPFVVHGLLRHEHKQTVLHFAVQRNTEYTEPVRAKDPLVLCVGPRRYVINPLFSQHVRGGGRGVNNVHKSERFLRPGVTAVATTYGPVCFGKAPCLLLRQKDSGIPDLVAMGSFLSSDPTRIIAKRIILTGHPFKVHKKTATIRYMFFDREDVDYFQTVELHTKHGRTGHIKEALGTHGYFKAHFDGPIQQMDTICMSLYKRQYPKWSQPLTVEAAPQLVESGMEIE